MKYHVGTLAECEDLQSLDAKARAMPIQGQHVGGGRHAPMTSDPESPGWTRWQARPRKHPTQDEWAYPVENIPEPPDRLTPGERGRIQARKATATLLGGDWEPGQGALRNTKRT